MHNAPCWHLIGKSGALKNKKLTLVGPEIVIGRTDDNDIVIPEHAVSRNHAKLEFKDGNLWLTDLNSKNGTYVNQEKISTQRIQGQDVFQIGDAKAIFRKDADQDASPSSSILVQRLSNWLKQKNNRYLASAILFTCPILIQLLLLKPQLPIPVSKNKAAQKQRPQEKQTSTQQEVSPDQPIVSPTVQTISTPAYTAPSSSEETASSETSTETIANSVDPNSTQSSENSNSSPTANDKEKDITILGQNLTSALSLEDYPAAYKILKDIIAIDASKANTDQLAFVEKTLKSKIAQYEENALREYEKLNYDKAITEWQKALSLAKDLDEDLSRKIQTQIKEAQEKFSGK